MSLEGGREGGGGEGRGGEGRGGEGRRGLLYIILMGGLGLLWQIGLIPLIICFNPIIQSCYVQYQSNNVSDS